MLRIAEQSIAPTPAASARRTRTPTSPARRCSPSPTGWAAPRPARSPRGSRSRRSRPPTTARLAPEEYLRRIAEAGQPADLRARPGRRDALGDGNDADRGAARRRRGQLRPRRRQPRLPLARRRAEPLTNDHSLVEELRRQGKLTRDQAAEHPQRSVITRALGPEPEVAGRHDDRPRPPRRRLPALHRRADDDARRRRRSPRSSPATTTSTRAPGGWSAPPTTAAAATTSPSSFPPSRQRRRGPGGRGRDPDRPERRGGGLHRRRRPGAQRERRPDAAGDPSRRPAAAGRRPAGARRSACCSSRRLADSRCDRRRRRARRAPGLVPRHRRGQPGRALPRPALRAAVRDRSLLGGVLEPDPRSGAARPTAASRDQPRAARPRRCGDLLDD